MANAVEEERIQFECIRHCQFEKKMYLPADDNNVADGIAVLPSEIVRCFACFDKKLGRSTGVDKDGKECKKCRGTLRSWPAHHFRPVGHQSTVEEDEKTQRGRDAIEKQVVTKELNEMGKTPPSSFSLAQLKEMLEIEISVQAASKKAAKKK